jgi:ribosomal protein L7Ae-like RNA K-turn-binding protein
MACHTPRNSHRTTFRTYKVYENFHQKFEKVSCRALNGVKFTSTNKKLRHGKKRKTEGEEDVGRQPKRQRVDEGEEGTALTEQELQALPEQGTPSANPPPPPPEELVGKRSQIVVGVNEVTRGLERNHLRAAVVCLSVRSPLLHDHLQVLSATRNVPCIALNGVSATVAPVLGLKRAMTIGLKKLSSDDKTDYFSRLADLISSRAPKITIPWLQASASATISIDSTTQKPLAQGKLQESLSEEKSNLIETDCKSNPQEMPTEKDHSPPFPYLPLAIKKTIITPKKRK